MIGLARPRWGHFELGAGYHGDAWLELDELALRPGDRLVEIGCGGGLLLRDALGRGTGRAGPPGRPG